MWTDFDKKPYMAVTAHWIEKTSLHLSGRLQPRLQLRTDLIGFVHVPGSHTGERMAKVFIWILERLNITEKVSLKLNLNKYITYNNLTDWMDYNG